MQDNEQNKNNSDIVKVTTYKNKILKEQKISLKEINILHFHKYHLFIDSVCMETIINSQNGKVHKYNGNIKGVGPVTLSYLKKLLTCPGRFLSPNEIGHIGEYIEGHFIRDNNIAYVARLRKHLFKENGCKHKFILTVGRPFRVTFNSDLSYCLIEHNNSDENKES